MSDELSFPKFSDAMKGLHAIRDAMPTGPERDTIAAHIKAAQESFFQLAAFETKMAPNELSIIEAIRVRDWARAMQSLATMAVFFEHGDVLHVIETMPTLPPRRGRQLFAPQ